MSLLIKSSFKRRIKSKIFSIFCWATAIISVCVLLDILYTLLANGLPSFTASIFTHDTRNLGLRNAMIGSLILTGIAIIVSAPIAILTATFLVESNKNKRLVKFVRFTNDILLSTPSVIVGLFIYTIIVAHTRFSGFAGIIALSIIAMPMITRASEDVLYLVSPMLKEAAIALGLPRWRVIVMIVYRSAKTGLITAVILAMARIMGESAPLLFTSAKNSFLSFDLTRPMESLPVMIFENAMQPYPELQSLAWTAALMITVFVLLMNLSARWLARDKT
ncbi:MAG: phosphate transport system permease protein [Francisellaceae bacterium]